MADSGTFSYHIRSANISFWTAWGMNMRVKATFLIGQAVALSTAATLAAAAPQQAAPKAPKAGVTNNVEADGTTALHRAAQRNDVEAANQLIRAGANVKAANRYGVTPLSLACMNGNAAMIDSC